jgi:hypothetical protein
MVLAGQHRWLPGVVVAVLFLVGGAAAQAATPVHPADLGTWRAKAEVRDRVLGNRPARLRANAAAASTELFSDHHGHEFTISTDVPELDLTPFAELLAGAYHHDEIEDLHVTVLAPEHVGAVCGVDAAACYLAEDAARSFRGQMWVPSSDPDLRHIVVHEYGHHVDNQLINLGHLGACAFDNDGSRN